MPAPRGPDPLQTGRFDREQLFANFFSRQTWWLRDNLVRYDGDAPALVDLLVEKLPRQDEGPKRTFAGLVLMWLGRDEGTQQVRATLQGDDIDARLFVLDQLRHQRPLALDAERRLAGTTLAIDDVARDLAPVLADPSRVDADWAREFCLAHAFEASRPAIESLRSDPRWRVARQVLRAYQAHDVDFGTLALLETWLREPEIRRAQDDRERLHDLCRLLADWVASSRHAVIRRQLGTLALSMLQQAMDAQDRAARLQPAGGGWLAVEALLAAVGATRPDGTPWLLQRMAGLGALHPLLRAQALVQHRDVTGKAHDRRDDVLSQLWTVPREQSVPDGLIADLLDRHLLSFADVATGLRHPGWTWRLVQSRGRWPEADAADVAASLLAALDACAGSVPTSVSALEALVDALLATDGDWPRERAIAALHVALSHASGDGFQQSQARHSIAAMQLRLGDLAGVDVDLLPPWKGMYLHWRRHGLDWPEVARLLAGAGMIAPTDPAALVTFPPIAQLADSRELDADACIEDPLLQLFALGGRPLHEAHLRDNGFEHQHDRLFAALACVLRPPLDVQDVSQSGDMQFNIVNPDASTIAADADSGLSHLHGVPLLSTDGSEQWVSYRLDGVEHRFAAHPSGTWMDDGSVLAHLDTVLAARAHPERVRSLHHWASWGDEGAHYVCVPADGWDKLQERLRLPIRTPPELTPTAAPPVATPRRRPTHREHLLDWTLSFP